MSHRFFFTGLVLLTGAMVGFTQEPGTTTSSDGSSSKHATDAVNSFAFDLYRELNQKEGNVVFSPYSISTVLAVTYGGARGKTAEEMEKTLRFSGSGDEVHQGFAALLARQRAVFVPKFYEMTVANGVWVDQGMVLRSRAKINCRIWP